MDTKDLIATQQLKNLLKFLKTKWQHHDKLEADGIPGDKIFSLREASYYIDIPRTLLQELADKGEIIVTKGDDGQILITKEEAMNVMRRYFKAASAFEDIVDFYLKSTGEKLDELGLK